MHPEFHTDIESAIAQFATAYHLFEDIQSREKARQPDAALIPSKGDQKTGLIGEYWAMRFARATFTGSPVRFGGHSEQGRDLYVETPDGKPHYIQVKTASAFGSGKLSPICPPVSSDGRELWHELWLLWLDRKLQPVTLWRLQSDHVVFSESAPLKGKSIRRPSQPQSGSRCFHWDNAEVRTDMRELFGLA